MSSQIKVYNIYWIMFSEKSNKKASQRFHVNKANTKV
jgi:hypothetical protein